MSQRKGLALALGVLIAVALVCGPLYLFASDRGRRGPRAQSPRAAPHVSGGPKVSVPRGTPVDRPTGQHIRVLAVRQVRAAEGVLRISGTGYARVDGGAGYFFWNSSTPPALEIEIASDSGEVRGSCLAVIESGIPAGKQLAIEGDGFFRSVPAAQSYLGIFRFDGDVSCHLVDGH